MPDPPGRVPSSGRSLAPEEVSSRHFPTARRGLEPEAVRRFLAEVAEQLREARRVESELRSAVEQPVIPTTVPPPDDPSLAIAVGEETRRVLQAAHEAARDIVSTSERRAAEIVAGAENIVTDRSRTAEIGSEELMERARADAAALLESTREQCRKMVDEARDARRRILEDLVERRHALHLQLEQLRAGKDALAEIVESAATSVLASAAAVRARLEGAESQTRAAAAGAFVESTGEELELDALAAVAGFEDLGGVHDRLRENSAVEPVTSEQSVGATTLTGGAPIETAVQQVDSSSEGEVASSTADDEVPAIEALFARIRAERTAVEPMVAAESPAAESPAVGPPADESLSSERSDPESAPSEALSETDVPSDAAVSEEVVVSTPHPRGEDVGAAPRAPVLDLGAIEVAEEHGALLVREQERDESAGEPRAVADGVGADLLRRRNELIAPAVAELSRSLKRQLRLEENELLDAFRNLKRAGGDPNALVPAAAMVLRFAEATLSAVEVAVLAGEVFAADLLDRGARHSTPAAGGSAAREVARRLAVQIVEPIGRRVAAGLAARGSDEDDEGVGGVVGAAFRDSKGARVDGIAEDFAMDAFAAGTLRASRARRVSVRWIVDDGSNSCPDCDDNGIAGLLPAGEAFPTGHRHPPVHPGCRCLLVPVLG